MAAAEEQFGAVVRQPYLNYGDAYTNAAYGLALTYQAQKREAEARAVVAAAVEFLAERGNTTLLALAQASQADIALRQGDFTAAAKWADLIHDIPPFAPMPHLCRPHVTLAKSWLTDGTAAGRQRAAAFLGQLQAYAEQTHNTTVLIEALALQALRQAAAGETQHLQTAERALTLARPGGYIRLFVDLGAPWLRCCGCSSHATSTRPTSPVF